VTGGRVVVKVGGSLFDLPGLGPRLAGWLRDQALAEPLLVVGGGGLADAVRDFDRHQAVGEEAAHWLALRTLAVSARMLAAVLPGSAVVTGWEECPAVWAAGGVPVLDAFAFTLADEGRPGALPKSWDVTTDAIAARAAAVGGVGRVLLLKSAPFRWRDWHEASAVGYVDRHLPRLLTAEPGLRVEAVLFRV
jgi:aspartokinase-like uncharacterized kinase